jgi:hypothetical protein
MKIDHLIFPLVSDENYKGAMVFLDIIVNESWDTPVKLLPHKKFKYSATALLSWG